MVKPLNFVEDSLEVVDEIYICLKKKPVANNRLNS